MTTTPVSTPLQDTLQDELQDTLMRQKSDPQPYIDVKVRSLPSDRPTQDIGVVPTIAPTPLIPFSALADTGCQSSLSCLNLLQSLCLQVSQLIPVKME